MPLIQSKANKEAKFPVSDETWAQYGKADLQKNFRVLKADVQPEVKEVKPTAETPKPRTSASNNS